MSGFASVNANGREPPSAWIESVRAAFPRKLQERITSAGAENPELQRLFGDIADHVLSTTQQQEHHEPAPNAKKRKLEDDARQMHLKEQAHMEGAPTSASLNNARSVFSCKDVSFQIPMRKKLKLDLSSEAKVPGKQEIRLINQTSNETEYALPVDQIEQAFCMAVPDKQARQTNFVLYPKAEAGVEPVVFAMNDAAPAADAFTGCGVIEEDDTYSSVTEKTLNRMLGLTGLKLVRPTDAEFASAIPQSHRKGEKGNHVRAHRGSKEGYLFFLPVGIFFGFKKPLAFFPFSAVESISYTSVLQRTFNLVITTLDPSTNETKETEFSMLDQADFAGIDEYIKRHELNDASMAAQRRAKAYNVNKVKGEEGAEGQVNGGAGGGGGEEGESELQKAEQALQDAEDEEEEDYEASGGESDGEGEESGEDGEGDEDGGRGEYDEDDAEGEEL